MTFDTEFLLELGYFVKWYGRACGACKYRGDGCEPNYEDIINYLLPYAKCDRSAIKNREFLLEFG